MAKKIRTLRDRITDALDVEGVHPGNSRWFKAFDAFFDALKAGATIKQALNLALDIVKCHDMALRNQAFVAFDVAGAEAETAQGEIKPQESTRPRPRLMPLIKRAIKWLTESN